MSKTAPGPPSPVAILVMYLVLGGIVSFGFGREPTGELPQNIVHEVAPTLVVICGFLVSYSLLDVLAVGVAKGEAQYLEKRYKDLPAQMPESVYLAVRAQTNQVEQMPVFLIGALGCALVVNGRVAAILALIWVVLRRCYASAYRAAVGLPLKDMGLGRFTIPAYFVSNSMLTATAIHAVRCLMAK